MAYRRYTFSTHKIKLTHTRANILRLHLLTEILKILKIENFQNFYSKVCTILFKISFTILFDKHETKLNTNKLTHYVCFQLLCRLPVFKHFITLLPSQYTHSLYFTHSNWHIYKPNLP